MPADWQFYADRAEIEDQLGKATARDADLARAVEHGADSRYLAQLADNYAERAVWDKAAHAYALAAARGPCDSLTWCHHALVVLKLGQRDAYRKLCAATLAAEGGTRRAGVANNLAWLCAGSQRG